MRRGEEKRGRDARAPFISFLVHPANEYLQYFHATLYNGPGGVIPEEAGIQSKCRSCCTDLSTQDYSPLLISSSRPVPTS